MALSACLLAPAAEAAVVYTFTGQQTIGLGPVDPNDPDGPQNEVVVHTSFTLERATFITDGTFTPDSCTDDNASFTCGDMEFNAFPNAFNVQGDFLSFGHSYDDGTTAFGGGAFYFFQPGAFGAAGVYTTDGWPINAPGCCYGNAGFATLVVSGAPDPGGAVPEPTTWALMITGFGGAGAMLRRRRTRHTFAAA
jgi:hypothetical protein